MTRTTRIRAAASTAVSLACLLTACGTEDAATNSPYAKQLADDDIGEPPEWTPVVAPDGEVPGYIRTGHDRPSPAPVYDKAGHLVGTFGCAEGAGGFTPLDADPECAPVTTTAQAP